MSKLHTAVNILRNNPGKLIKTLGRNGFLGFVPDKLYLKIIFRLETGYRIDFQHPKTYNEKINWLKLYDRKPDYKKYADKYEVRTVVQTKIGEEYLVPLISKYDEPDEIDFDSLPKQFVLKSTNGSGGSTTFICRNKEDIDYSKVRELIRRWMKVDPYKGGREWCYKGIKPRIICEELLNPESQIPPDDYKFMCFNGEPRLIQYHHDRYGHHTLNYYYPDWTLSPLKRIDEDRSDYVAPKPESLDKMLDIARTLSRDMYYARVDLYNINGKIYFGEITMYPTSGFSTFAKYEDDLELGSWLKLPCDE